MEEAHLTEPKAQCDQMWSLSIQYLDIDHN